MGPLHPPPSLAEALAAVFAEMGVDPRAWALGFARATPAVTLIPAFGLAAVPVTTRLVLGLSFGLCVAPALSDAANGASPLLLALGREALLGLPVALLGALSAYVAMTAGGLVDDLRGGRESVTLPALPEPLPPVAALFALLSSVAFLETGGAARVAAALSTPLSPAFSWPAVVQAFSGAVGVPFATAAPLGLAGVLLEAARAPMPRAATPAFIGPVLSPLKSVVLLGILALVFERIAELLVVVGATLPAPR